MMPGGRGEWKSMAADSLQRRGRGNEAKSLLGTKGQSRRPAGEMTAAQMREEGERRAAMPEPRPMSLWARLRALIGR